MERFSVKICKKSHFPILFCRFNDSKKCLFKKNKLSQINLLLLLFTFSSCFFNSFRNEQPESLYKFYRDYGFFEAFMEIKNLYQHLLVQIWTIWFLFGYSSSCSFITLIFGTKIQDKIRPFLTLLKKASIIPKIRHFSIKTNSSFAPQIS